MAAGVGVFSAAGPASGFGRRGRGLTTQFFRSMCTLLGLTHEGRPRDHLGVLLHQPVTTWTEHVQQGG
ncbi:MAG: hypothetical protein HY904_20675 [Deltaproteobacteria bacterium]|nr:hypothetical protein [Deltaproteobacteria bacterium]